MWGLKSSQFLSYIPPNISSSAARLRNRWLHSSSVATCSGTDKTMYDWSTGPASSSPPSRTRKGSCSSPELQPALRHRRASPRQAGTRPAASSASAAASTPFSDASSNGDQDLSLTLDYQPTLTLLQEGLCVAAAALLSLGLFALLGRWHGGGWLARAAGVVLAAVGAQLLRTLWMEGAYKARERTFEQLGDPDSRFRPIGSLGVHVKVKVGQLPLPPPQPAPAAALTDQQQQQQQQQHEGERLAVAAAAAPEPVCAVHCYHGFGANLGSYKRVQELMAGALRGVVTAHDMPGFGLSQRPSDMSSYFLTFNGRLGRLVMDYELQQLGLLPPAPGAAGAAGAATAGAAAGAQAQPQAGQSKQQAEGAGGSDGVRLAGSLSPSGSASSVESDGMPETPRSVLRGSGMASTLTGRDAAAAPVATSGSKGTVPHSSHSAIKMTLSASQQQGQQQVQPAAGSDGSAPAPVKRILLGHSLGGACAALEAVTDPDGLAGLVLVAPAVLAFPGADYAAVTLSPERAVPCADTDNGEQPQEPLQGSASSSSSSGGAPKRKLHFPEAQPVGSHPTDPPEVRRLYPVGQMPYNTSAGTGMAGGEGGAGARSAGRPGRRRQRGLLRALGSALQGWASALLLAVLRLLSPIITLLLRALVRRRAFWVKGLQQAYYNPSFVTPDIVDAYRMPQLVRGWEEGMVKFLLARLVAPSAGSIREALSRTKAAAASPAAAAVSAAAAGGASAADSESRQFIPSASPTSDGGGGSSAAPGADDIGGDAGPDDANLALRLGALVAARRLPVLLIHGLYDRLVPASNSQRLARMLPGCELVLLDRCGHMPQEEMPELFTALVAEFAARVGAPGLGAGPEQQP